MKKIQLLNKIAKVGTDIFNRGEYEVGENVENPDAVMVRSASMLDMTFSPSLRAIGRAGAGVNNIPVERCAKEGIVVFNTPGANAGGVKELTVAALILASRDITGGIEWVKTLQDDPDVAKTVEKGKSAFVGHEVAGKKLGVIGLGAIGGMVANTALSLGMKVLGCDPFITVNAAWSLSHSIEKAASYDDIFKEADYITLHVPATAETKGMINKASIEKMKDGVRIINLARADLVNAEDLKEALASGKVASYVTDFPTPATVGVKGIINIPHLGASTYESEDNCAVMAAQELDEFLRTGNIRNSVNYPSVSIPHTGAARVGLLHKNVPAMLSQITSFISENGINIENLSNGSKGEFAYTIVEMASPLPQGVKEKFEAIDGMIRVTEY
ncbi:MAG: 3-phosphoglycerate dehydrogenase family protein [Clostridia bacterium]|nr:3-phosphoglycerate dehydrogenase family protein [Clostridia bacterium]